jgi:hypothetical protein
MSYWSEVMQDDVLIADEGWKVGGDVSHHEGHKGQRWQREKEVEGWKVESKLIKPGLLVDKYFRRERSIEAIKSASP